MKICWSLYSLSAKIAPGGRYLHHPHHRNGRNGKSQWIIPPPAEQLSFTQALSQAWLGTDEGWGLLGRRSGGHAWPIYKDEGGT